MPSTLVKELSACDPHKKCEGGEFFHGIRHMCTDIILLVSCWTTILRYPALILCFTVAYNYTVSLHSYSKISVELMVMAHFNAGGLTSQRAPRR